MKRFPSGEELPSTELWTRRYEQLRQQVLSEPGGGWGQGLVVQRGLVAWMQAWPTEPPRATGPAIPTEAEPLPVPRWSSDLRREIGSVLVNMILAQREVIP